MSYSKKVPDNQRWECARAIWENEGQPIMQAQVKLPEPRALYWIVQTLGFSKAGRGSWRGQYVSGPCLGCMTVKGREAIGDGFRCASCQPRRRPQTNGHARPRIAIDYAWEREESRKRMEERWAGERPNLGQPRTPVSRILRNERLA